MIIIDYILRLILLPLAVVSILLKKLCKQFVKIENELRSFIPSIKVKFKLAKKKRIRKNKIKKGKK